MRSKEPKQPTVAELEAELAAARARLDAYEAEASASQAVFDAAQREYDELEAELREAGEAMRVLMVQLPGAFDSPERFLSAGPPNTNPVVGAPESEMDVQRRKVRA